MTTIARFRIPGVAVLFLLLLAPAAQAQSGLNFFKNWFVTGDYVVGGVGLEAKGAGGLATGTINVSGVPANSVVLGAFLYWETIAANVDAGHLGATFKGNVISSATQPNLAHVLTPDGTTACWTGAGAPKVFAYRADVLRFLEQDHVSGRLIANGPHVVKLPDSGNANALPSTAGATLVIIYRDPTKGLRGISVYDGALTLNANVPRIDVPVQGWYQSQIPTPSAKLTPIAGGGSNVNPLTSYTYRPIGIIFEMTPRVTYDNEIILDLYLENSALGVPIDVAGQSIPSFIARKVTTRLRLREGESTLLAGLLRDEERTSATGFPGLLNIPVIRQLFAGPGC